jgi:hypothetical protein
MSIEGTHRSQVPSPGRLQPSKSDDSRNRRVFRSGWTNWRALLGWHRDSSLLLSGFLLTIGLIAYLWWPLAQEYLSYIPWDGPWWRYIDWLLIGIFLFMSLTIITRADLRADARIILIGAAGGLVIESWGTQTSLWTYYTAERPPLWIIPAWPIASLSIDRLTRLFDHLLPAGARDHILKWLYWPLMVGFYALMLVFVWPTLDKPLTWCSLGLCLYLILTERNPYGALLAFTAGAGLGYFLERWGTTRECWTYYTLQKPPFFAVLAHGMAAVAFWRSNHLFAVILEKWEKRRAASLSQQ